MLTKTRILAQTIKCTHNVRIDLQYRVQINGMSQSNVYKCIFPSLYYKLFTGGLLNS